MIQAIIIDDDSINIKLLHSLLQTYCPFVNVIETATNVEDGAKQILKHKPDILFLDIEIHDKTGFDLLKIIVGIETQVILITAHEKYAIQGIRFEVADYILKPISIEILVAAVNRCKNRIEQKRLEKLSQPMKLSGNDHVTIVSKEAIDFVHTNDVVCLSAKGRYCEIVMKNNMKRLSSKSLKEHEIHLPPDKFIRVHNSHVVHVKYISKLIKLKSWHFIMIDGLEVPIAESKKQEVAKLLDL